MIQITHLVIQIMCEDHKIANNSKQFEEIGYQRYSSSMTKQIFSDTIWPTFYTK